MRFWAGSTRMAQRPIFVPVLVEDHRKWPLHGNPPLACTQRWRMGLWCKWWPWCSLEGSAGRRMELKTSNARQNENLQSRCHPHSRDLGRLLTSSSPASKSWEDTTQPPCGSMGESPDAANFADSWTIVEMTTTQPSNSYVYKSLLSFLVTVC